MDSQLNILQKIDGIFDLTSANDDFNHYRHSADEVYLLWNRGRDELAIVDIDDFQCVDSIKNFWSFEGRSTSPRTACSNRSATIIVAVSDATPIE